MTLVPVGAIDIDSSFSGDVSVDAYIDANHQTGTNVSLSDSQTITQAKDNTTINLSDSNSVDVDVNTSMSTNEVQQSSGSNQTPDSTWVGLGTKRATKIEFNIIDANAGNEFNVYVSNSNAGKIIDTGILNAGDTVTYTGDFHSSVGLKVRQTHHTEFEWTTWYDEKTADASVNIN